MATEQRRLRGSGEILLRHPADGWSGTGWRVGRSRVRPSLFAGLYRMGYPLAEILRCYPDFTAAQVQAAIAFRAARSAAGRLGWGRRKRNAAQRAPDGLQGA